MPHVHTYHPESGWCGCGQRDTGQRVNRAGWYYMPRQQDTDTTHEKDDES